MTKSCHNNASSSSTEEVRKGGEWVWRGKWKDFRDILDVVTEYFHSIPSQKTVRKVRRKSLSFSFWYKIRSFLIKKITHKGQVAVEWSENTQGWTTRRKVVAAGRRYLYLGLLACSLMIVWRQKCSPRYDIHQQPLPRGNNGSGNLSSVAALIISLGPLCISHNALMLYQLFTILQVELQYISVLIK